MSCKGQVKRGGIRCPACRTGMLDRVRDTRAKDGRIKRYRRCRMCGHVHATYEVTPDQLKHQS